jgi:hypothetical protein
MAPEREARRKELRAELLPRMRDLCGSLPDELFADTLERLVLLRLQEEERVASGGAVIPKARSTPA